MKWKAILALLVIYIAVFMDWDWVWGALFVMWTIPALYSGRTYLVEEVHRDEEPILFWVIVATWFLLSFYLIVSDLLSFF